VDGLAEGGWLPERKHQVLVKRGDSPAGLVGVPTDQVVASGKPVRFVTGLRSKGWCSTAPGSDQVATT
jgi:hypothetical protein